VPKVSNHPDDLLIRELIITRRSATPEELERIVQRVATASFASRSVSVPTAYRGKSYAGRTLGAQESASFLHLVQRVVIDRQWAPDTTLEQLVDDLHEAARHSSASYALYLRRGTNTVLAYAPNTVPAERRGPNGKRCLVIIYNADFGRIASGYGVDEIAEVSIPGDALWVKQ
jgi:hypothetical protein